MRAYIEHRLDQRPGVKKLYYMGPMFRRERPQKGRYRQFFQIGAEAIGSESPVVDAEVIEMVVESAAAASGWKGFSCCSIRWAMHNCRPVLCRRCERNWRTSRRQLCGDCQRRADDESAARAGLQSAGGPAASSTSCLRYWIICARSAARTLNRAADT